MKFIQLTGATLREFVHPDEMQAHELDAAGVTDASLIRVNEQGDIEIRRREGWDVIGGLLGDYQERLKKATGLDWA